MKQKIKIGLDFDGVVAYNPFRLIRYPISLVKRKILGIKKLNFFYPKSAWQQVLWKIIHDSSVFPAKGMKLLEEKIKDDAIEAHLITARYSFLDDHLHNWLSKYKLKHLFKTININKSDEQPHIFKEKTVEKLNLDIFIEDNLDIVKHIKGKSKTKIFWIYNILDRRYPYPHKFPYLEKALEDIIKDYRS